MISKKNARYRPLCIIYMPSFVYFRPPQKIVTVIYLDYIWKDRPETSNSVSLRNWEPNWRSFKSRMETFLFTERIINSTMASRDE